MQTSDNISTQTAVPKLPAKPSYGKSSKATQIDHFRRFCKGGTKGKPPKKKADLRGLKNNLRKSHDIFISMRLKCKHRTTFRRKRRLQNCPQGRVMANLAKPPKSAIFADFAKGDQGTTAQKEGRLEGPEKQPAQIAWSSSQIKMLFSNHTFLLWQVNLYD